MARSRFSIRSPSRVLPLHWLLASTAIIPLDYFTGPYLDSMVLLYPIPAAMAAWSDSPRWSMALAAMLPPLRMLIFHYWGWPAPTFDAVLDTAVIVLFCIAIAFLILHLRRQALTLRVLESMLPICGFCKRIRNGQAWEPLEGFISEHSEALFSHTFCAECGAKHYGDYLEPEDCPGDRLPGSVHLQVIPQGEGGVVLGIVGAEDQSDRSPARGLQ